MSSREEQQAYENLLRTGEILTPDKDRAGALAKRATEEDRLAVVVGEDFGLYSVSLPDWRCNGCEWVGDRAHDAIAHATQTKHITERNR